MLCCVSCLPSPHTPIHKGIQGYTWSACVVKRVGFDPETGILFKDTHRWPFWPRTPNLSPFWCMSIFWEPNVLNLMILKAIAAPRGELRRSEVPISIAAIASDMIIMND